MPGASYAFVCVLCGYIEEYNRQDTVLLMLCRVH
jgi:hypothetical protein